MFKKRRISSLTPQNLRKELAEFDGGHRLETPDIWQSGVVFASPHSGSLYPASFLTRSDLSIEALRRNEDMFVNDLVRPVLSAGAPLLCATFPRAYVDVNRSEDEIAHPDLRPPKKLSARATAGLGVVPTHMNESTAIYRTPPNAAEIEARLNALYRPYHRALSQLLDKAKARFGQALLIDCHSMPGFAPMGARRPDIILGDRFGVSCHADTVRLIQSLFEAEGYSVGINYPYAGGYVTTHYGRPQEGVEAIQIEINRDLYLNPITQQKKRSYDRLAENLAIILPKIIDTAHPTDLAAQ